MKRKSVLFIQIVGSSDIFNNNLNYENIFHVLTVVSVLTSDRIKINSNHSEKKRKTKKKDFYLRDSLSV